MRAVLAIGIDHATIATMDGDTTTTRTVARKPK
jgi:hypothetical protein